MSSLRNNYGKIIGPKNVFETPIYRPGTDDGTLFGNRNMNVDGSTTPQEFYITADPGRLFAIGGVPVRITDGGNPAFDDYGNVNGPLVNGLTLSVTLGGTTIPLTPNIKRNIDWLEFGPSIEITQFASQVRLLSYNFSLFDFSSGIMLNGNEGDRFSIFINDDLTDLVDHEIGVQGYFKQLTVA